MTGTESASHISPAMHRRCPYLPPPIGQHEPPSEIWSLGLRAEGPAPLAQAFTLEDVKNLLGHSSIVLTSNTCGHVLEQRQRQVAMRMVAVLGG